MHENTIFFDILNEDVLFYLLKWLELRELCLMRPISQDGLLSKCVQRAIEFTESVVLTSENISFVRGNVFRLKKLEIQDTCMVRKTGHVTKHTHTYTTQSCHKDTHTQHIQHTYTTYHIHNHTRNTHATPTTRVSTTQTTPTTPTTQPVFCHPAYFGRFALYIQPSLPFTPSQHTPL